MNDQAKVDAVFEDVELRSKGRHMIRYVSCIAQKFPFNKTRYVVFRTTNGGGTRQYLADESGNSAIFSSAADADAARKAARKATAVAVWTDETRMPA